MIRLVICLLVQWLFEAGREAYILDRDIETNMGCAVLRGNLMRVLGFEVH